MDIYANVPNPVPTERIKDQAITTAKIADLNVTLGKLENAALPFESLIEVKDHTVTAVNTTSFQTGLTSKFLIITGRLHDASASDSIALKFNDDATATYTNTVISGSAVTTNGSQNNLVIGRLYKAGATLGGCTFSFLIQNSKAEAYKEVVGEGQEGGGDKYLGGTWSGGVAITKITVFSTGGATFKGKIAVFADTNLN